jgi:hypothetical protein
MRFAVLQKDSEPVSLQQLSTAFAKVPGLTAMDAKTQCEGASGILVRNFDGAQASALQAGLEIEGIKTEIVPEAAVPVLPLAKQIRRAEITPDALLIDDQMLTRSAIPWGQIVFIAAGCIQEATFQRTRTEWEEVTTHVISVGEVMIPVQDKETKFQYNSRESAEKNLRADLIIASEPFSRLSIELNRFDFFVDGKKTNQDLPSHFAALVRKIIENAKGAYLNRGPLELTKDSGSLTYYPRKPAFEGEMSWLIWKSCQRPA